MSDNPTRVALDPFNNVHIKATPRVLSLTARQTMFAGVCAVIAWRAYIRYRKSRSAKPSGSSFFHLPFTTDKKAPDWMVERHIVSGYRRSMDVVGCASSAGGVHNETFNIWSHAFAALWFLNAFFRSHKGNARWQALAGATLFSVSAFAHCFSATGPQAHKLLFSVDRAMIAVYFWSISIFISKTHFAPEGQAVVRLFILLNTVVGGTAAAALASPALIQSSTAKFTILLTQITLGVLPVLRELYTNKNPAVAEIIRRYLAYIIPPAITGGLAFALHFPESWLGVEGMFDVLGTGHNVMHVLTSFAAYLSYRGCSLWELELARNQTTPIVKPLLEMVNQGLMSRKFHK